MTIEYSYEPRLFEITVGEDFVGQITWVEEGTGQPIVFSKPCTMKLYGSSGEVISFDTDVDGTSAPSITVSPEFGVFQFAAPSTLTYAWPPKVYKAVLWAEVELPADVVGQIPFSTQKTEVCRGTVAVRASR